MSFYNHTDKQSGDGLALTDWNNLSSAIAGRQGLTLALNAGDKVGIGTTSPGEKLQVNGNATIGVGDGTLKIGNIVSNYPNWSGIAHKDHANANEYALAQDNNGTTLINSQQGKLLHFRQGNVDKMVINNGDVGIGTPDPSERLEVNGKVKATHFIGDGSQLTNLTVGLNGLTLATQSGNVGIGTPNPGHKLEVAGNIKMTGPDFEIDVQARRGGQSGSRRRALVHDHGDKLTINHSGDYTGGVHIASGVHIAGGVHANGHVHIGGGTPITRIIAGNVFANGSTAGGSGFSCTRDSAGEYTVTFDTAFSPSPVVLASCTDPDDDNVVAIDIQRAYIKIFIHDVDRTPEDGSFSFIAIGL